MNGLRNPDSWRIYYDDGSTFEGDPLAAPADGVIVIACYENDVGRQLLHGWDWYVYRRSEGWYGCDLHGLLDNLKTYPDDFVAVKQGRTAHTKVFRAILDRADTEMPRQAI